jgi:hypothetical protein
LFTLAGSSLTFNPPTAPLTARYWRIRCPTTYLGDYLGITELEMRSTIGGVDQTTGKTAFASTNTAYGPAYAIDDQTGTLFTDAGTTKPSGGHWLAVDYGSAIAVAQISIQVRTDGYREDPRELSIECSTDGTNWIPVCYYSNIPAWTAGETRTFLVRRAGVVNYSVLVTATDAAGNASIQTITLNTIKSRRRSRGI